LQLLHTFDNLMRFKPKTLQFVTNNLIQIIALPEWKEFCSDHGDILREILEVTANNRPVDEVYQKQMQLDVPVSQTGQFNSQPAQYPFNGVTPLEDAADPEVQIINPPPNRFQFPLMAPTYYPQNQIYPQQPYQQQLELNINWSSNQTNRRPDQ
jgi:hypothetical protein